MYAGVPTRSPVCGQVGVERRAGAAPAAVGRAGVRALERLADGARPAACGSAVVVPGRVVASPGRSPAAAGAPSRSGGVAREAEVDDAHLARAGDHHVLALEVAVHQLARRARPPARGPPARRRRAISRQLRGAACSQYDSVCPSTNSMATKTLLAEAAHVVDRDDVGVRQARHRLRLAQQARLLLGQRRPHAAVGDMQQLDRDLAVQLGIVGRVDLAHPAPADQPRTR